MYALLRRHFPCIKTQVGEEMSKGRNSEVRWVLIWALIIVMLSSLPYIWGTIITPPGYHFLGLTQNIDDGAVYLSWMRQVSDGHFFLRDLFTNEHQTGRQLNLLFLLMGLVERLTGLSGAAVYHLFRALFAIGLIFGIYRFSEQFLDRRERLVLIPLVGLSSGIGWLIPNVQSPVGSVDIWQPEAITFLSIYLNPLFLAGLILMLGIFYFLLKAEKTGRAKYAVYSGLLLFMLGNIHSYDVLTVACVWLAYMCVRAIAERKIPVRTAGLSLLAGLIGLPSIAYQIYVYTTDLVYHARANTMIASPPVLSFFTGYGLALIAAIAGAFIVRSRQVKEQPASARYPQLFVIVWSVVGFMVPYIPIAQQRKLIMGMHIPLCILAAIAVSHLASRMRRPYAVLLVAIFLLLGFQSNAKFLTMDAMLLSKGRTWTRYSPYLSSGQMKALMYIRHNAHQEDTVFGPPQMAVFVPAIAGRQVYYGHWSETPDCDAKMAQWYEFTNNATPPKRQADIIRKSVADFIILSSTDAANLHASYDGLRLVKQADYADTLVYRVVK